MASPIRTGKQPVQLAADGPRASRIRRDPPPVAKQTVVPDHDERDRWAVAIGIVTFTLAIAVVIVGAVAYGGWSPSQYTIHIQLH